MTSRILTGIVLKNSSEKTISVLVRRKFKHKKYSKYVVTSKKYLAHCEGNMPKPNDKVQIKEVAPISKRKKWLALT